MLSAMPQLPQIILRPQFPERGDLHTKHRKNPQHKGRVHKEAEECGSWSQQIRCFLTPKIDHNSKQP